MLPAILSHMSRTTGAVTPNPERRGITERAVEVSADVPVRDLRWSATSVSTFEQCPLKLWWGKVAGWQEGPSVATAAGTAVHEALEHLLSREPGDRTQAAGEQLLVEALEAAADELEAAQVSRDEVRTKSEAALQVYWQIEDPTTVDVLGLETPLGPQLGDVPFSGYADRLAATATGVRVTDYKTGAAKPRYFGPYFRQQYLYAAALEADHDVTEIELLFLGDGRRVRRPVYPAALARAVGDLTDSAEQAQVMADSGVWTARQSPLCGWCSFEKVCPLRTSRAPLPGSSASNDRLAAQPGMIHRPPVARVVDNLNPLGLDSVDSAEIETALADDPQWLL